MFEPVECAVPTSIGDIGFVITDRVGSSATVKYYCEILDADGDVMRRKKGNLGPHLSAASIAKLQEVKAEVRELAQVYIPV